MFSFYAAALGIALGSTPTLVDHPIAGPMDAVYLDGSDWLATHQPPHVYSPPSPPVSDDYSQWSHLLPVGTCVLHPLSC